MKELLSGAQTAVAITVLCFVACCIVWVVADIVSWIGLKRAQRRERKWEEERAQEDLRK